MSENAKPNADSTQSILLQGSPKPRVSLQAEKIILQGPQAISNLDADKIVCYNLTIDKIGGSFMEKKPYHHGDLKKSLIESGIEFINEYGEENLSLRKIAEACGVSNAAPYAHFKNKEDFINAMQEFVLCAFMDSLVACANQCRNETDILSELGVGYVMFFYHNPHYFDFLFSRKNSRIRLSSENKNTSPFELFRETAKKVLGGMGLSEEAIRYRTIAMWSLVHGLSALSVVPDIDIDWRTEVKEIICSVDIMDKK